MPIRMQFDGHFVKYEIKYNMFGFGWGIVRF